MSDAKSGFGQGFGCVFGAVAAGLLVLAVLFAASRVVAPCSLCRGSGNGVLWGKCSACDGSGFRVK